MTTLARAINALRAEGISLEQAAHMSDAELLRVPGLGRKVLRELREHLADHPVQLTVRVPAHAVPHITAVVQAFGGGLTNDQGRPTHPEPWSDATPAPRGSGAGEEQ